MQKIKIPQYVSGSGGSGSVMFAEISPFFSHRAAATHTNATRLSSSGTCCDTDLERSSCCRPEDSCTEKFSKTMHTKNKSEITKTELKTNEKQT